MRQDSLLAGHLDLGYEVVRIKGHCSPGPVEIAWEPFGKTRQLVREVDGRSRPPSGRYA